MSEKRSPALLFWEDRPFLPAEVKEYVDETVKEWMEDPVLKECFVECVLRKNLEDACLKAYEENEDPDLEEDQIDEIAKRAEADSNIYTFIEKGLMEGFEREDGELIVWWTELGKKVANIIEKEEQDEANKGNTIEEGRATL